MVKYPAKKFQNISRKLQTIFRWSISQTHIQASRYLQRISRCKLVWTQKTPDLKASRRKLRRSVEMRRERPPALDLMVPTRYQKHPYAMVLVGVLGDRIPILCARSSRSVSDFRDEDELIHPRTRSRTWVSIVLMLKQVNVSGLCSTQCLRSPSDEGHVWGRAFAAL